MKNECSLSFIAAFALPVNPSRRSFTKNRGGTVVTFAGGDALT
jgi:hypothetical protein